MSEAPVSERRLIEILNAAIIPKFDELRADISGLKIKISQLKGFQDHESDAIRHYSEKLKKYGGNRKTRRVKN